MAKLITPTARRLFLSLLLLAASLLGAAAIQAQTPVVIDRLPYVINAKGTYVLNSDLSSTQTTGNLIEIKASNVTVDFQGHFISGPVGNTSQTTNGVYAGEKSNVTVRNGTIAFCDEGIYLLGSGNPSTNAVNAVVDNMRVTYCYTYGIRVDYCPSSRITNCQVSQTGYSGGGAVVAISALRSGALVQGNVISGFPSGGGYGIFAIGSFVHQNVISGATYGVYGGKYQDNLTLNCTTAVTYGTDAGGNN